MSETPKNKALYDAIQACKQGDKAGFHKLFSLYKDKIYRYFYYLFSSKSLAEELTQETFLKVFQNISNLNSPFAFHSWIHSIATRLYLDYKKPKKNKINDQYDELSDDIFQNNNNNVVLKTTVEKILSTLSLEEREAVLHIDLLENTYEETAQIMQLSMLDLNQRIRSGRQKFIDYCKKNDVDVTGIFISNVKKTGS